MDNLRYDPTRALISLHMPKTAGTSFTQVLQQWFGDKYHRHYFEPGVGKPPQRSLEANSCIHGHFNANQGCGVSDYYETDQQFIAFFREPFSRYVSLWRFLKTQVQNGHGAAGMEDDPDFGTWFWRTVAAHKEGRYPRLLLPFLPGYPDPASAIAVIRTQFVGIGLTEDYERSVAMLALTLGKLQPAVGAKLNVSVGSTRDFSSFRRAYEQAFASEYEIYEAALARRRQLMEAQT